MIDPQTTSDGPLLLGIRSFEGWGDRPERTLDLSHCFSGRFIRDESLWDAEVLPNLKDFLYEAVASRRPIVLDFAAHTSIAFAAGYVLEAKSGLDITLRQRLLTGVQDWKPDDAPLPEGPFWKAEEDWVITEDGLDVAVAVGITHPVLDDTVLYLVQNQVPVRRILPATLAPEPGNASVPDGAHALALAQALCVRIRARTPQERQGTLHLFISAPNALVFYLGQLARGMGQIRLYEYDFDSGKSGAYAPSILLR